MCTLALLKSVDLMLKHPKPFASALHCESQNGISRNINLVLL